MSKYILLINWTEQGVRNVKSSPSRWDAAKDLARKAGCSFETIYMTFGPYDLVAILDAPSDEVAAKLNLQVAMGGNIRTLTLKAFGEEDYRKVIGSV